MTVRDLHEMLEALIDDGHGDDRVLLAMQPSWPLAFEVGTALAASDIEDGDGLEDPTIDVDADADGIVWLTEAGHPHDLSPYAPKALWR